MNNILTLIFLCYSNLTLAQYKVDSSIKNEYLKLYGKLPPKAQQLKETSFSNGLGIATEVAVDTLNRDEIERIASDPSSITSVIDSSGNEIEVKPDKDTFRISSTSPLPMMCTCERSNNTLIITSFTGAFSGFAVRSFLYRNELQTFYEEWDTDVERFKLHLKDEKSFRLKAKVNGARLTLNSHLTNSTTEIYGRTELISPGFYDFSNNWSYKNGYLHKRIRLQFYFSCNVKAKEIK